MGKRWGIAAAGILLQVALGAVYAWSVFRPPLARKFGWSISQVTLTFTIAIFVLGLAAFFGGLWQTRKGPRVVAMTGGLLYGGGIFLASFTHSLPWLYFSYGVIGGAGVGLCYIVPIAVLVKWFPERRGLMTGVAVGGFGAGALFTAPIATRLIATVGVLPTFAYLGLSFLAITVAAGFFMQNPPAGWQPTGWQPAAAASKSQRAARDFSLGEALRSWQWWALWSLLFLNTCAGISLISQEVPIFQELGHVTALAAAGMLGIVSIGNAAGRVLWAWVSDAITRRATFAVMFALQVILFWALPSLHGTTVLTGVAFLMLMCYGGGFGTMPAFAADYFGARHVGSIYGLMLTAWGFASAFGPLLIAHTRESSGSYASGLHIIAGVMLVSTLLPLAVRPPRAAALADAGEGSLRSSASGER